MLEASLKSRRSALRRGPATVVTDALGRKFTEEADGARVRQDTAAGYGFVVDTKPDAQLHEVLQGALYLGSQDAATNLPELARCGITHILNVATGVEYPIPMGITYEQLQVLDLPETTLDSFIPPSMAFLVAGTAPGKATLVHCNAGVSRSATVVIAFLMLHRGMTFDDALATAKRARPSIRPNNGFRAQLQNLVPL